jgi:hypothetical protein|tara:strand:- start:751 stop:1275 length:525 start_codon:yes stop_codon:yes gene_type:complete
MYALVESGSIRETFIKPKSMQIGDFKYAKNIFTLWTESELNAIGLYTVEEDNSNLKDSDYYTNASINYTFADNKVTSTYNSPTAKNLASLKTLKIEQINETTHYLLNKTDWYIVKSTEISSYTIPSSIINYRASVRVKANSMETQINNALDVDALAALYIYTDGIRPLGELPTE